MTINKISNASVLELPEGSAAKCRMESNGKGTQRERERGREKQNPFRFYGRTIKIVHTNGSKGESLALHFRRANGYCIDFSKSQVENRVTDETNENRRQYITLLLLDIIFHSLWAAVPRPACTYEY